jgi:hypothetical protein
MAAPTPPPNNGGSGTPTSTPTASWAGAVTLTGTIGSSPCQLTVDSTGKTITLQPAPSGGAAITLPLANLATFATGIFKDAGVTIALPSSIGSFPLSSLPSLTLSELQINLGTGGVTLDAGVTIPSTSALNQIVPGLSLTAISFDLTRTAS